MKKIGLIFALLMLCGSLTACGSQSTKAKNSSSEISSLKKENSQLKYKHHKKQNKKKQSSSSSASSNNNSNVQKAQTSQQQNNSTQVSQQNNGNHINNADDALAAAKAKYGDGNGNYHWTVMYDASTGQPIRNDDGSYFVKAIDPTQGTMTGTAQSVNVYPDGSMTNN